MIKNLFLLVILSLSLESLGFGQTSIIDQIQQTQNSIVTIHADISSFYKTPGQKAAIDPKTGKMVLLRTVTKASYNRAGAGVVIHPDGIIVTNAHVVDKANQINVTLHDGRELPAKVLRLVGNLDVALLKIETPTALPAVGIADSDQIRLGQEIITVGNSALLNQTVSGGKIKGLGVKRTDQRTGQTHTDLIQITVNVYEGDSGGPLFDRNGLLIGLITAKETGADHSSFAIPSNKIKQYLLEYLQTARNP
jgi:S1-C subfamily serine protease